MFKEQIKIMRKTLAILVVAFISLTGIMLLDNPKASHADNIDLPETLNHICAGKRLTYRKHVDAAYVNQVTTNKLDIKVVDGRTIRDADKMCIRLAPDATPTGEEVSRWAIPADRQLAFLGKPGDILWSAPQQFYRGWAPIWAGIGALESEHEELPLGDIIPESVKMDLVELNGPGQMEMFTYSGKYTPVNRIISSADKRYASTYMPAGTHTHSFTTFTKPGIYKIKWQGHATLKNGEKISSPVREVIWLVGSDEQVGLPEGTTTGRTQITKPVEENAERIKSEIGDDNSNFDPKFSNDNYTPVLPEDWGDEDWYSEMNHISHGHLDIKASWNKGQASVKVVLLDESDPAEPKIRKNDTVAIEVPDSSLFLPKSNAPGYKELRELSDRKDHRLYELPELQNPQLPWLGFNTEDIDYENIEGGVKITGRKFNGPGRVIIGNYNVLQNDFTKVIDLAHPESIYDRLDNPTHIHRATYFTQPGMYSVEYSFSMQPKGVGRRAYGSFTVHYLVGTKTINASRKIYGIDLLAETPSKPSETDTNTDNDTTTTQQIQANQVLSIIKKEGKTYFTYGEGKEIKIVDSLDKLENLIETINYYPNVKDENILGITEQGFYYREDNENKIYFIEDIPDYEDGNGTTDPAEIIGFVRDGYYYIHDEKLYKYEGTTPAPVNKENKIYGQYWKLDPQTNKYIRDIETQIPDDSTDNNTDNGTHNPDTTNNEDNNNTSDTEGNDTNTNSDNDNEDNENQNGSDDSNQNNNDEEESKDQESTLPNTNVNEKENNTDTTPTPDSTKPAVETKPIKPNNTSTPKEISYEEYEKLNGVVSNQPKEAAQQQLTKPFMGNSTNVVAAPPSDKSETDEENNENTEEDQNEAKTLLAKKNVENIDNSNESSIFPLIAAGLFGAGLMLMLAAVLFFIYVQRMLKK